MKEAFEQAAVAMSDYMTEIDTITIKSVYEIEVKGDDILSLLYRFLDEILFLFCAEPYHISRVSALLSLPPTPLLSSSSSSS